jgi:hypothetical protein
MKKAFIGRSIFGKYICFTRWKKSELGVKAHSEENKYDVDYYVKLFIVNWIGKRIIIGREKKLSKEEVINLIVKDYNKLVDEVKEIEKSNN